MGDGKMISVAIIADWDAKHDLTNYREVITIDGEARQTREYDDGCISGRISLMSGEL